MPECAHCGREVMKLLVHPFTNEYVCLKCMTRSGFFSREVQADALPGREERRSAVRIPVSVNMEFEVFDSAKNADVTYPALSVNLSTAGICFAWEHCSPCLGYEEGKVHEKCLFHPYYINNEEARELKLSFNLTVDYTMHIPCFVVYTIKEREMDVEYVGACFSRVTNEQRRILELIIHKYGRLS